MESQTAAVDAFLASPIGRVLLGDSQAWFRLLSPDGTYLYVSPQVEAFLGYTPNEFSAISGAELMHPDEMNDLAAASKYLANGAVHGVYRMLHKEGHYVWVSTMAETTPDFVVAVGRVVPERIKGIAWAPTEPFL